MKVALVAMNGLRVCDPELIDMGLTLPGFLERGRALASMPSLALLTLAALTPKRHQIEYIEIPDQQSGLQFDPRQYDLVAISSYSAQISEAYAIADRCRSAGVKVVIGGPHVTALPQEALSHCDAVCLGEGEPTWATILSDCERGQLQPYYGARFSDFKLDDAPLPAFHLLDPQRYNRLLVQTSRGCPHRCEFCAGSILIADRYKQKPQHKVLAEIDMINAIWRRPFIELADDNAFVNRAYWYDLLPELSRRHVRWFAETDISIADDDRLLGMMHDAGCAQVLIGLESPSQSNMDRLETRSNWKYRAWPQYQQAIRRIQSRGIRVIGCFVLGLDGQNVGAADDIYEFAGRLELFDVQVTIQTAFPGTPLYARLQKQGRLIEETNWDKCTLFDVNFQPTDMTVDQLRSAFKTLCQRLYGEEVTDRRRGRFREHLRALRPVC